MLGADGDGERQADARPDRIAPADPVPEAEDAARLDAEFGDLVEPGRDGGEVVDDRAFAQRVQRARRARSAALVIVSWVVKVLERR